MNKRVLLIDGDVVAYQLAAATEKVIEWDGGVFSSYADADEGRANLDHWIKDLEKRLKADETVIALSDPTSNFRKEILPSYKNNRAGIKPPMIRRRLEKHIAENYNVKQKVGLEADDVLGILATNGKLYPNHTKIIVSIDKDLLSVPGRIFNWRKASNGVVRVDSYEADRRHLMQTLTGDQVDGYAGCPGIGHKRAESILDISPDAFEKEAWSRVLKTFQKAGLGPDEALIQARVARILRTEDFDYKNQRPKLWNPKV